MINLFILYLTLIAGPYTIFVPTDKAFRTLLVQLGGPEKAEQKFHDNPRLLSGVRTIQAIINNLSIANGRYLTADFTSQLINILN